MADLLTHVLVTYVVLTVASWRIDAITPPWVAVAMGGSAIPDLIKVRLLVDDRTVRQLLWGEFTFEPISTIGGVALIAIGITMLFDRDYWRRAYAFLVIGGLSSLIVDGLRVYADGHAGRWLFPLTWWRPPTPSLYVTSDPRIAAGTIAVAAVVAGLDWRRQRSLDETGQ